MTRAHRLERVHAIPTLLHRHSTDLEFALHHMNNTVLARHAIALVADIPNRRNKKFRLRPAIDQRLQALAELYECSSWKLYAAILLLAAWDPVAPTAPQRDIALPRLPETTILASGTGSVPARV